MKFKTSLALLAAASFYSHAEASNTFDLENVFDLEYANQIEMTKNGDTIYFVRNRMDIKSDRKVSNIWSVNPDGKTMLPLTSGVHMDYSPVLSPDETRLAFISTQDGSSQIYVKWLKTVLQEYRYLTLLFLWPKNLSKLFHILLHHRSRCSF